MYLGLSRAHFLSPTGQCKPFDASADGYCRGEGCGLFVIKRLCDALREDDRIYGIIKGAQINQSGQSSSITHPHGPAQKQLFETLLSRGGLDAKAINVIEAHGTGTQVSSSTMFYFIDRPFSHLIRLAMQSRHPALNPFLEDVPALFI
jgi:acyl transferase domain-containing protein